MGQLRPKKIFIFCHIIFLLGIVVAATVPHQVMIPLSANNTDKKKVSMEKYEILKQYYRKILELEEFDNTIKSIIQNRMYFYNVLKEYFLKNWKPNGILANPNSYFNYAIDYCFRCMVMDGKISGFCNTNVVYFIRNEYTGLLKIGKTNNLKRRIHEINRAFNFLGFDIQKLTVEAISYCPFGVSNSKIETYYHNKCKEYRVNGEWFDISPDFLYENLIMCADYIIKGIPVVVEDGFDCDTYFRKIMLIESNSDLLYEITKNELSKDIMEKLGIKNSNMFTMLFSQKRNSYELFSYDIWNYITNLKSGDEFNLDKKIIYNIENMLI